MEWFVCFRRGDGGESQPILSNAVLRGTLTLPNGARPLKGTVLDPVQWKETMVQGYIFTWRSDKA